MVLATFDPSRAFGPSRRPPRHADGRHPRPRTASSCASTCPASTPTAIDVTVDRGVLTVSAKRSEEYAEGEKPVHPASASSARSRAGSGWVTPSTPRRSRLATRTAC